MGIFEESRAWDLRHVQSGAMVGSSDQDADAMICFMLPNVRAVYMRSYGPVRDGRLPSMAGLTIEPNDDGTIRFICEGPADLRSQNDVSRNGPGAARRLSSTRTQNREAGTSTPHQSLS
jgi:hypothetical protein